SMGGSKCEMESAIAWRRAFVADRVGAKCLRDSRRRIGRAQPDPPGREHRKNPLAKEGCRGSEGVDAPRKQQRVIDTGHRWDARHHVVPGRRSRGPAVLRHGWQTALGGAAAAIRWRTWLWLFADHLQRPRPLRLPAGGRSR